MYPKFYNGQPLESYDWFRIHNGNINIPKYDFEDPFTIGNFGMLLVEMEYIFTEDITSDAIFIIVSIYVT